VACCYPDEDTENKSTTEKQTITHGTRKPSVEKRKKKKKQKGKQKGQDTPRTVKQKRKAKRARKRERERVTHTHTYSAWLGDGLENVGS
jgi:hypothetical protein